MADIQPLWVVLGNQLFPPESDPVFGSVPVFMAEDLELCTFVRHHKQKLVLFLAAMRRYRDSLIERGVSVEYHKLPEQDSEPTRSYEDKLDVAIEKVGATELWLWEVEDRWFESRLNRFASDRSMAIRWFSSPMFLTSRAEFADWLGDRRPRMASFYEWQRRRLEILIEPDGNPLGGRWSFDTDGR